MSVVGVIGPLLGFVLVAIGARAFALYLRRRGHGEALDALYVRASNLQGKILRGKGAVLRSVRPARRRRRHDPLDFD